MLIFLNDIKNGKNLKSKFINAKNYLFELLENIDDSYKNKDKLRKCYDEFENISFEIIGKIVDENKIIQLNFRNNNKTLKYIMSSNLFIKHCMWEKYHFKLPFV